MTSEHAIELSHVAKTYRGKVHALRGVDMRVARGEVFGLLGPNGAGKSTLVKILMTVIRPTRCEGSMLGHRIGHKPTLGRVGYLPEHHQFPDYLTGAQVLHYFGALAKTPRRVRKKRVGELLDLVGMTRWRSKKLGSYSKGMRQRIGVAQALINDPELVLLDEPTDGVDPVGRRDIRAIIARLRDDGKTVFLNSHLLSELEMVCDRVAILVQGQIHQQGTIDELTADQHRYLIQVGASDLERSEQIAGAIMAEGVSRGEETSTLVLDTTDAERIQPVIDALRGASITIEAIRTHRPSLEDLFMRAVIDPETGKEHGPGAAENTRPRVQA